MATAAGARKRGHAPIEALSDEQAGKGRASAGNEGGVAWGSAQSHGSHMHEKCITRLHAAVPFFACLQSGGRVSWKLRGPPFLWSDFEAA